MISKLSLGLSESSRLYVEFFQQSVLNTCKGFCNTLFNGFASDITKKDKLYLVGLKLHHFSLNNTWVIRRYVIIEKCSGEVYCKDSKDIVIQKCAALFLATFLAQTVGLSLNLLNRIGKIVSFAHLWNPTKEPYSFTARLGDWGKDLFRIVSTPLIFVGMLFSTVYGMMVSPYDGRKLYGTLERLAYSGGYQFLSISAGVKDHQLYLLAPCFQPEPRTHLGGGVMGQANVW